LSRILKKNPKPCEALPVVKINVPKFSSLLILRIRAFHHNIGFNKESNIPVRIVFIYLIKT
jgi:hypothetical protein